VVDFSLAFTDTSFALGSDLRAEVWATCKLLATARQTGAPVIFTTQVFDESHPGSALWRQKGDNLAELLPGSRWAQLDPRLSRQKDEPVIEKLGASALFETETLSWLQRAGADTVLVCGATTSGCVRATVVDLLQSGIPPVVLSDCVGDRSRRQHEASIVDMGAKYADVVVSDVALDYLRRSASTSALSPRPA
jgi:nicotinamidase-related amidase